VSWEVAGFSDAGQLDHPILFLTFTEAMNEYGEVTYIWAPYARDWAELLTLSTGEKIQAAQLQAAIDVALRVRWREDITEQMRVQIDDDMYDLVGPPREAGRHRFIELLAKRRDPGQAEGAPTMRGRR
jgi:SPP1 family predicted phage head-tail adaptor